MSADTSFSVANRKIDPTQKPGLKPDGTPDDNDRVEIGPTALAFSEWADAGLAMPNMPALRQFRYDRLVRELNKREFGAVMMMDPLNIRYATDSTNMQLWNTHNPFRACILFADGYMILWDYKNSPFLADHNPLVREVRSGASMFYFGNGDKVDEDADIFYGRN